MMWFCQTGLLNKDVGKGEGGGGGGRERGEEETERCEGKTMVLHKGCLDTQ